MSSLRIALLDYAGGQGSHRLAEALRAAGHRAERLQGREVAAAEMLLNRRGFTPALSCVPPNVLQLLRGDYDIVHAFSATDAVAALLWRRMKGGRVAFTCTEVLERETLANARLRLYTLARAIEDSDALVAADEKVRASVERWFAQSPAVIAADDTAAYEHVYEALVA